MADLRDQAGAAPDAAMILITGIADRSRRALIITGTLAAVGAAAWALWFMLDAKHDDPTQTNRAAVVAGPVESDPPPRSSASDATTEHRAPSTDREVELTTGVAGSGLTPDRVGM